jgi:hypothetical protein
LIAAICVHLTISSKTEKSIMSVDSLPFTAKGLLLAIHLIKSRPKLQLSASIVLEVVEFGSGTFVITCKCLSPGTHDTVSSAQRMVQNSGSRVVSIAMSNAISHFVWCFTYISIFALID